ncbi:MAG: prenyltransferase [Rikenellaceae bacterium]|nr:prenyltransferase [Rikenellaceae bacterium]
MKQKLTFKDWFLATRPWSFTASALSVVVVLVYLEWLTGAVNWTNGTLAILGIILFHAAGNTWSDYCDYKSGVDTVEGAISIDTIKGGLFRAEQIRNLSFGLLVPGIIIGLWLLYTTGWGLLWIGLGGVICTLCYPPLKYRALGDLVIILAYGLLPALGASWVAVGELDWRVLWAAFPVALLVDAILHANNTRDAKTDSKANIRTMAMGMGVQASVVLYVLEQLIPFIWVVALIPFHIFPWLSILVTFVMRFAIRNTRAMREFKETGNVAEIADLDQRSAQTQMLFAVVLCISFLVDLLLLR